MELLAGKSVPGSVVYNVVSAPADDARPRADLAAERRFKVVAVSNYAYVRGIDRLIDVAAELKRRDRGDVLFIVAGATALSASLPGELGRVARAGGTWPITRVSAALPICSSFSVMWPSRKVSFWPPTFSPSRRANTTRGAATFWKPWLPASRR